MQQTLQLIHNSTPEKLEAILNNGEHCKTESGILYIKLKDREE